MGILIIIVVILVAYLYLIAPATGRKEMRTPFLKHHYAHRGLHDNTTPEAPENTIPAFRKAVEQGYGIELDVQLTKDDQVVVFHDDDLKRLCGVDAPVISKTYEELRELNILGSDNKIPLFSDVLQIIDGKVPLCMEIKMINSNTHVCEKANEILKDYKGIYCMESFHPFAVRWYRKNRPDILRGQLSANFSVEEGRSEGLDKWAVHHLLFNHICKPDFISFSDKNPNTVSRWLVRRVFGGLQFAWTIKSQEAMDKVKDKFDLFIFEQFIPRE